MKPQVMSSCANGSAAVSLRVKFICWAICAMGAIFYSYEYLLRMSPSVMAENLMRFYHLTGAQFGYLSGSYYYYSYVIMQILVGLLLDRYGPRRLLTVACLFCALGAYLFACSDHLPIAMMGRFMVGFGSAFAFVGAAKLATIWLPPNRFALVSGIIFALGMLGAVFGDIVLRMLVDSTGWQNAMYVSAALGFFLTALIWLVVRDVNPYVREHHSQRHSSAKEVMKGLGQAVANPQIWLSGTVGCMSYLFLSAFAELWGPAYLGQAHGLTRQDATLANSMVFLGCALGAPLWGWFSDFLELRKLPLIMSGCIAALLFGILLYVPNLTVISIYIILLAIGFISSAQVLVFAIAREVTPIHISGTAIGLLNMIVMLGGVVFPPVIGKLLDTCWAGELLDGARVYSPTAYMIALSVLPLGILLGVLVTLCIRETYCKIYQ